MKLLFVNACVREHSRTLLLARYLLGRIPAEVTQINLEEEALEPLTKDSLAARERLLLEGKWEDKAFSLAQQFAQADCIVIAAPYWDLGFPALLKIYLERITVAGITFCYDGGIPRGLCRAKKLYYVTTAGGPIFQDFGFPYVKALAQNLYGIRETICISAQKLDMEGEDVTAALEQAVQEIDRITQRT